MWVSIDSEAACSAALHQALDEYGIVDTAVLQAVLEHDAAGLARALCTALQATSPAASAAATRAAQLMETRAARLMEAEARAVAAERRLAEAEARCAAAEALQPVKLSLQIQPRGVTFNAQNQTPKKTPTTQVSVAV